MPIQNVGTLLENLVVTEATLALLRLCHELAPFEFLNSFAMPLRTPWVPHSQNVGFDPATLVRVRAAKDSELPSDIDYSVLLRANLLSNNDVGPNAALLVAGATLQSRIPCRMWLNDIREGHYGDAIPELERICGIAQAIYRPSTAEDSSLTVRVSDTAYPGSFADLARVLPEWNPAPGARLGFLDPMRYRVEDRQSAETSSEDHRRWLAQIAYEGLTCAIHFTGNRNSLDLEAELCSLQRDAVAEGYAASRAFKRQHYVVFVAVRSPTTGEPEGVADEIEGRIQRAWKSWEQSFAHRSNWQLRVYRNGSLLE
jgi:hypothetical protein